MFWHILPNMAFWVTIIAVVFVLNYFPYKLRSRRYDVIEALAEKNLPIPPTLLSIKDRERASIRLGIFLMAIGISLAIILWVIGGEKIEGNYIPANLWVIGVFPLMIGLAQMVAVWINRRLSD